MFAYKLDSVNPILEYSAKGTWAYYTPILQLLSQLRTSIFPRVFEEKKTLCGYSILSVENMDLNPCPDHTSFKSGQVNFSILMFCIRQFCEKQKSFIHFIPTILSHMNVAGEGSLI